jgi:hypothetical protein
MEREMMIPSHIHRKDEGHIIDFFDEDQTPTTILDGESERLAADNPHEEILRWHCMLGHTSFAKLKLMTAFDIFSRKLATVHPPTCAGCIFGATTKKLWRTKANPSTVETVVVMVPGDCVSVDQLESSTPGFMTQLKGILTKRR